MSQERKTHWTLTYRTQGGDAFQESTRVAGIEPATEAEMKEGLAGVIADRARTPLPAIYVQDQLRDGLPTLVFLGRMSHVELAPDIQPGEEDAQRHLELVLTDPPLPGEPATFRQEREGRWTQPQTQEDLDFRP